MSETAQVWVAWRMESPGPGIICTSREVAQQLTLSPRTVEMHVHRILVKLDCRTRVDITRRAAELGLLA